MKPSPGMVIEAKSDFDARGDDECIFIGDTLTDMIAAREGDVSQKILTERVMEES